MSFGEEPPPGRFDPDAPDIPPPEFREGGPTSEANGTANGHSRGAPKSNGAAVDGVASPRPAVVDTFASVLDAWATEGPLVHEPTGIASIDDRTGGGPIYGTRWFLTGSPDSGKTALLIQIADTFARRGVVVGLLTVDEEAGDVTTRFAQRAGFRRADCEKREAACLLEMRDALADAPVRLYGAEHTIESAALDVAAFAESRGARAMLGVDSIQVVTCDAVRSAERELSPREVVTANAFALRHVASAFKLIAITTSEMNRGAYRSMTAADDANDLASGAESRAIEYQARVLCSLRSVKGEADLSELRLVKNKHGPAWRGSEDSVYLRLDRMRMRLEQTKAPDRADPSEARESRAHEKGRADAAKVAVELAMRPGIGKKAVYTALRAAHGTFSHDRADAGLARLGDAVHRPTTPGRGQPLYLDGAKLPSDILAAVPLERRPEVSRACPPEASE